MGLRGRARWVRAVLGGALLAGLATGCAEPARLLALDPNGGEREVSLAPGAQQRLYPMAIYSDGATDYVGAYTDWVSSNTSVATVEDQGDQGALVYAVAPGQAVVTATYLDVSASVTVTVVAP